MKTIYHIDITNGVITYNYTDANRFSNEYHAPNAKQYFAKRADKPVAINVKGWPFEKMYITHGTDENGLAIAWSN
jgi:hypothetical protein